jgi:hypothetical protein
MGSTLDLGSRIELVSMDPHFHDVSIGLYQRLQDSDPEYLVHSYSRLNGVRERLDFLIRAMKVLGGMTRDGESLRFPCRTGHRLAIRRVFLESCKLSTSADLVQRPLTALDKKLNCTITVTSLSPGVYELSADELQGNSASRIESVTNGFKKLAQIEFVAGKPHQVKFSCGWPHDALIGLLLPSALNVRAAQREEEMATSRGMLVAPSAQK